MVVVVLMISIILCMTGTDTPVCGPAQVWVSSYTTRGWVGCGVAIMLIAELSIV